jgi:uncharacterized protein YbjT (DUF2867 family)
VDAARRAGVPHLVYSSAANADQDTGIPTFESKKRIEEHLRASGVPYTIVAPAYFMENLLEEFSLAQLGSGVFARWLPVERSLQYIAVGDIARFVVKAFEHRTDFLGHRIDLAGDQLNGEQGAEVLSHVLGRAVRPVALSLDGFPVQGELAASIALMLRWLDTTGFSVDIGRLHREHPDVGWRSLEQWARAQDWSGAGA